MLELLQSKSGSLGSERQILEKAEKVGYYRVVGYLYRLRKDYMHSIQASLQVRLVGGKFLSGW